MFFLLAEWRRLFITRFAVVSFGMALLLASCTLSAVPRPPTTTATLPSPPLDSSPTPIAGSALLFDGQDDYVRVEDHPSLDLEDSFTISAWIYLQGYTEWASIVTKGDKPNINNYAIQQSGPDDPVYKTEFGKLRFSGCNAPSAPLPESRTTLSLGRWYFVAVTFDGMLITFYLNGEPDGSRALNGPLCPNDQPLYIGADFPLTSEYWQGAIDELRIWNTALSASQIQDLTSGSQPPQNSALVGYWSFDEGSGSLVRDLSGNENHGTIVGDPVWISPGAPVQ